MCGLVPTIRRVASTPSRPGMCRSSTATSGCVARDWMTASIPVAASATTTVPSFPSSSDRRPRRNSSSPTGSTARATRCQRSGQPATAARIFTPPAMTTPSSRSCGPHRRGAGPVTQTLRNASFNHCECSVVQTSEPAPSPCNSFRAIWRADEAGSAPQRPCRICRRLALRHSIPLCRTSAPWPIRAERSEARDRRCAAASRRSRESSHHAFAATEIGLSGGAQVKTSGAKKTGRARPVHCHDEITHWPMQDAWGEFRCCIRGSATSQWRGRRRLPGWRLSAVRTVAMASLRSGRSRA